MEVFGTPLTHIGTCHLSEIFYAESTVGGHTGYAREATNRLFLCRSCPGLNLSQRI